MPDMDARITRWYEEARQRYAAVGVDVDAALAALANVSVSTHCWQADDVAGFEHDGATLAGGGLAVTGGYPGKARTIDELRRDIETALALTPGRHRLNLHAMYGEFRGPVDRDAIEPRHFEGWVQWARERGMGLDFNPTCFSHPKASDGLTLSHPDPAIRSFWVEHCRRSREIGVYFGKELSTPGVVNLWIPDGGKDHSPNRCVMRRHLMESLDRVYAAALPPEHIKDSVESKLFGIGAEAFTVGSHEFYLGYALTRRLMPCLDLGHFHPTESVADKVSSLLLFFDELLVHVSRPMRWDSDHVVILDDPVRELMQEIVRAGALQRTHLALDYFDASINRVGAYVIGLRATLKAVLAALLEPLELLRRAEEQGDGFARLAYLEEAKSLPLGAVWEYWCAVNEVPPDHGWIDAVRRYGEQTLSRR